MTIAQAGEPTPRKPLRLWPGVVAVTLEWLAWWVALLSYPRPFSSGIGMA